MPTDNLQELLANYTHTEISHQIVEKYDDIPSLPWSLRIFYCNLRSIRTAGKLDEIKCILTAMPDTHIIIFTETWITSRYDARLYAIENYTHYYSHRRLKRGGGVSMYVRDDLKCDAVDETEERGNHYLWIEIDSLSVSIGAIYKPSDTNLKEFLERYEKQLKQRPRSIVFGDFNIDINNPTKASRLYTHCVQNAGYKMLNKISKEFCTRDNGTKRTIIDHLFTNIKDQSFNVSIIDSSLSDHKQIYLQIGEGINENSRQIQAEIVAQPRPPANSVVNSINLRNKYYRLHKAYPDHILVKCAFDIIRQKTLDMIKKHVLAGTQFVTKDAVSKQQDGGASSSNITSKIRLFNASGDCDEDPPLPSTSNGARTRSEAEETPTVSNIKKDILSILPKPHMEENVDKVGEDITVELAASWQHLLANGLDMPEKKMLEAKYPVPRNCVVINAPELNPSMKNELSEVVLKKDAEVQNKQKQITMIITCISKALTKLIDRDGDRDIIKILVDAGKLLCDFQYSESNARRNAIAVKFNRDLKNQLLENKVDTLLFGEKWKDSLSKQFEVVAMKKQIDLQMQSMLHNQSYHPQADLD